MKNLGITAIALKRDCAEISADGYSNEEMSPLSTSTAIVGIMQDYSYVMFRIPLSDVAKYAVGQRLLVNFTTEASTLVDRVCAKVDQCV